MRRLTDVQRKLAGGDGDFLDATGDAESALGGDCHDTDVERIAFGLHPLDDGHLLFDRRNDCFAPAAEEGCLDFGEPHNKRFAVVGRFQFTVGLERHR